MIKYEWKQQIDNAVLVSFDVFDTLIFRCVNEPETIFDLVGRRFGLCGYRAIRMQVQSKESYRLQQIYGYPHADMDEIYAAMAQCEEYAQMDVDWNAVKAYEIQAEKDAIVCNKEMYEVYSYAKSVGKRVVATTDMYLSAKTIGEILENCGYAELDYIYCSADERKAKFDTTLFTHISESENVSPEKILHIGDNASADVDIPKNLGFHTLYYRRQTDDNLNDLSGSDIDKGVYQILYDEKRGFWYNLGLRTGGPMYMGLYLWLSQNPEMKKKKLYLLSRDGYNLYQILKALGYENVEYLYTSRRALLLAGITELSDEIMDDLPPYTFGQTVRELLDWLKLPESRIEKVSESGFCGVDDRIDDEADIEHFRKLLKLNEKLFLERCQIERENAAAYFKEHGVFDTDCLMFDCGWSGSSQVLVERFRETIGATTTVDFLYFGIRSSEKSCKQTRGKSYRTFAFDCYTNYELQSSVDESVALYELFFGAPHAPVFYYNENVPVLESDATDDFKKELADGILDFVIFACPFAIKYGITYTPEEACAQVRRLIYNPTEEEVLQIGNIRNVDSFGANKKIDQRLAYLTEQMIDDYPNIECYWLRGLLKRPDVSDRVKQAAAARMGMSYPMPQGDMNGYQLENIVDVIAYYKWKNEQNYTQEKENLTSMPFFSVVMPVYNTKEEHLVAAITSVLEQSYLNFELILVDDSSTQPHVRAVLERYNSNEKVVVVFRMENGNISVATNEGIERAKGDYIAFMDCDDVIDPEALYEFARKISEDPSLDFIYSDEDKLTEDGLICHMPFFKPEWSPDLFMTEMYTNHLAVYRTSIVKQIGGLRTPYNGAQDYDMTLRFMEVSDNNRVGHIPKVLYHWRERKESIASGMQAKGYATVATKFAKEDALRRRDIKGHTEYIHAMSQYRVVYDVEDEPRVSIIIPSKDQPELLGDCIHSIEAHTSYSNYEIIIVDNGSSEVNRKKIEAMLANRYVYVYMKAAFNFSKICNMGAAHASGSFLLFLNDDVEIIQHDWLERMLGQAQQKHVGAVGIKLLYPDSTIIQHDGVTMIKEGPSHNFICHDDRQMAYFAFNRLDYDCTAVTAACLMVGKDKFDAVGGFCEDLAVAYNDVEFCIKLRENNFYNVVRNDVVAFHHESFSRGIDEEDEFKIERKVDEMEQLFSLHPKYTIGDDFLNPNLHNYSSGLDVNIHENKIRRIDLSDMDVHMTGNGVVDGIWESQEKVFVSGWSLTDYDFNDIKRQFILGMPGTYYALDVVDVPRVDLMIGNGNDARWLMRGFICVLDKAIFGEMIRNFSYGMLTQKPNGRTIYTSIPCIAGCSGEVYQATLSEIETLLK